MRPPRLPRPAALLVPFVAVVLGAAACASESPQASTADGRAPSAAAAGSPGPHPGETPTIGADRPEGTGGPLALPDSHVHAVSKDPGSGDILVATHEGLHVYGKGGPRRVGPNIDLMGFTVAGPGHYLASGHPGPGGDLPQPVGLIESRDGGQTWTVLSRGGSSDFHALAAGGGTVVGFDGALRVSQDGRSWTEGSLTSPPRALAVSPDGRRVLATTADGLKRSTDGGSRWSTVEGAPLLLLVDWAQEGTAAGLGTDGRVYVSADEGASWRRTSVTASNVQALDAVGGASGPEVIVATDSRLVTMRIGDRSRPQ
jgi:hypothetical protein